jgi:uncharacterized protein
MSWNLMIAAFSAWLLTRIIKVISAAAKGKLEKKTFFRDGGMPSSHTALAFGLVTAVFLEQGASTLFAMALVFSLFISWDAMSVRWIVGEHSKRINELFAKKKGFSKIEESVGHTPPEVICGALVGIIVPMVLYLLVFPLFP